MNIKEMFYESWGFIRSADFEEEDYISIVDYCPRYKTRLQTWNDLY